MRFSNQKVNDYSQIHHWHRPLAQCRLPFMEHNDTPEHIAQILGFGLDSNNGHIRLTEGEDFKLMQGSEKTHEEMREILEKLQLEAHKKGKELHDLTREEFMEIARELPGASNRL